LYSTDTPSITVILRQGYKAAARGFGGIIYLLAWYFIIRK